MTLSVNTSGSQTCTIGTEHSLATITGANVYQLALDLNAMAGGSTPDILEVREYGKARSGDTKRLIRTTTIVGAQSELLLLTVPRISPHYFEVSIKQTQGTGRAVPWAVYQVQ